MTKPNSHYLADTPVSSIEEDEFGRADFAKNLAKSIVGVPAEGGFVFALNAPWGSGKTSTLNMVQEALQKDAKVSDGKEEFIIVNFNPWWFSGGDTLIQDFFRQFRGALIDQSKGSQIEDKLRRIAGKIRTFSSVLTPFPVFGEWAKLTGDMAGGIERLFADPAESIGNIRQDIHDSLRKLPDLRMLVIMDDLDRIQPNEMREMFRLIKGVADFPNTIYLLPFDREVVIDAIADKSGNAKNERNNAEKYLGKIIQMSLDLPPVNSVLLHDLFYKKVKCILEPIQPDQWDENYWWILLQEMSRFIQTPRDMKRLLNGVGATYPMVRGKANPMDFVAIQGIRIFTPYIYDEVAKRKRLFVEMPNESTTEEISPKTKKEMLVKDSTTFCKEIFLEPSKERGIIAERVLARVFPFWNDRFRQPNPLDQVYDGANRPKSTIQWAEEISRIFNLTGALAKAIWPSIRTFLTGISACRCPLGIFPILT